MTDVHWVNRPENQCETSDGAEERSRLLVLVLNNATTVDGELIDHNQVGNTGHGVPSPLGSLFNSQSSEETSQDHDKVGNNGHEDVGTRETSEQGQI